MKKLILAVLILMLAGCAAGPRTWSKPGATVQDFQRDKNQCLAWAGQVSGGLGEYGNPLTVRNMTMDCLRERGWKASS